MTCYRYFKRAILSGFDPSVIASSDAPTFPMWGYGWLLLITENKLLLLALQNALAIFAVWFFIRRMEKSGIMKNKEMRLLKLLIVVSIPWYVFHSNMWPNSLAVSLFLFSFVLFIESVCDNKISYKKSIISGLLFGFALNFRSDYFFLPIGLVLIAIIVRGLSRYSIINISLWAISIYMMLIPWAVYTKHTTGHYLFKSTNGGAVLFIGLGRNLPGNKWGISAKDQDPFERTLIKEHFGKALSPWSYEADQFLKRRFLQLISEDPLEYVKKCLYSLWFTIFGGVYPGDFFNTGQKGRIAKLKNTDFSVFLTDIRAFLYGLSTVSGLIIIFLSFIVLPFVTVKSLIEKDIFFILLIYSIAYQTAINIFGYNMSSYTSNMYLFHLINLIFGSSILWQYLRSRLRKNGRTNVGSCGLVHR